jgi:hypothetical protein
MEVTTFDTDGKNPQTGTIEVKNNGNDRLTVFTFGNARQSELLSDGRRYLSYSGSIPYYAEVALRRVLHLGPEADDFKDVQLALQPETISKIPFDCIVLQHQMKVAAVVRSGVFPAYCLQRGTDAMRIAYDYGMQKTVVNGMAKFLDHQVPTALSITELDVNAAEAKVTNLSTFVPTAKDFEPTPDDTQVSLTRTKVGGKEMVAKLVDKGNLRMPPDVRRRQPHGAVLMHVEIGRDGHVHSVKPVTFPDPDLVALAMLAVHQWKFSPFTVNDVPVDVETNIVYNFGGGSVDTIGIRH